VIEPPASLRPGFPLGRKGLGEVDTKINLNEAVSKIRNLDEAPIEIQQAIYYNPKLAELQRSGVEGTKQGLELIRESSDNPWYRELATKLTEDGMFNPRHEVVGEIGEKSAGRYQPYSYKVLTKDKLAGSEMIFMHENMHAATHSVIQGVLDNYKQFDWAKGV